MYTYIEIYKNNEGVEEMVAMINMDGHDNKSQEAYVEALHLIDSCYAVTSCLYSEPETEIPFDKKYSKANKNKES